MTFPSIRLEGTIISADVLDAIAREDKHSQRPQDFGLAPSDKVKDEIASTWASAKAHWTSYQARITSLREGQTGTTETRNLFVLPLLTLLGYQPEKADAEIVNAKSYAISHRDVSRDGLPLHIMGWNDSLDKKRTSGGPRISPHALVQEYLNLTEHLYGVITNGRLLRLLRDSSRLIKLSFLEFDLMRIFEEDLYADFALLFRLLHASRMPANRASAPGSILEKYHQDSVDSGSRIRDGLAAAVAYAMQTVANGLLAHPANGALADQLRDNPGQADELHQNLLRWVYRTLFLLVIEERGLNHAPEVTLRQRRIYRDFYSLQRLRRLADRPQLADRRVHDLWRSMHQTLRLYEAGGKGLPLGVAPLGSFLFREDGLQALFQYQLDNRSFLQALNRLSTFRHPDTNVRMRVNYGALDVEEFGSVYESLLELRPRILPDGDKLTFSYTQLAGNERKTTGSYYTPDSLVQCLLDSALDPVVEERLTGKSGQEAEAALLQIKVCDPAVGSGHFLIGAAHRLAQRLAEIRAGEEALSPEVQHHALRDVVSHCLYGVDINPLSVELCKVSLWMLAMEPGKPLGFLDHHIQWGNSLLGVTPRLLDEGLPDAAFKPIAGDDKTVCKEAKKRNKDERSQLALFHGTETKPWEHLGNLPAAMLAVDAMSDDTTAALRRKEDRYAEIVRSSDYQSARFLADAWCAAFVWKKTKEFPYPITNDVLRKIERNPHDCAPWMRDEIERLRDRYQFFHWNLAFPEVFPVPTKGQRPANERAGWNGGFDVMLGNPPWENAELSEKEWFAEVRPDIANARTGAVRKRMIESLRTADPQLYERFVDDSRSYDAAAHIFWNSGLFPLCGRGRVNLYAVFAEQFRTLLSPAGRVGAVIPTGIATDDTTKHFFQAILADRQLISLFDFENEGFFPAAGQGHMNRFCLFTIGPAGSAERAAFVFRALHIEEMNDASRRFELGPKELSLINPLSKNCPVFRTRRDFQITNAAYERVPIFIRSEEERGNPWQAYFQQGLFNMTADSELFLSREQIEQRGSTKFVGGVLAVGEERFLPLFEGKMIHHFNHRFGDFSLLQPGDKGHILPPVPSEMIRNPSYCTQSRHWVSRTEVENAVPEAWNAKWFLAFRDVANDANARTAVSTFIPRVAVGHGAPLILTNRKEILLLACLQANLSSFVFDFVVRQKIGGTHLTFGIFNQLPVLPPATYAEPCAWAGGVGETLRDWLLPRVLELTYTAWELEPFARDCGWFGPPFVWDEARRFQLRCELDAAFFHLYGLNRDDTAYILDTFPIVRRKDEAVHGTYRTKDTILALYDHLAEAQRTGIPFESPLNPPAADRRACHPERERLLS